MGTIYYGLAGEGHGHSARASVIIEHLRRRHQVVVLTFGKSLRVLQNKYAPGELDIRKVPGLYLRYGWFGRMSPTRTVLSGAASLPGLAAQASELAKELEKEATLVISDFEPISLKAAAQAGVPSVSIDHQRFLQACAFDHLPWQARAKIAAMAGVIDHVYGRPARMIISGFQLPPLRSAYSHAHTVGALIREELFTARPEHHEQLLVYVRRKCPRSVLTALEACGRPVRLYGLGAHPRSGSINFCEVSQEGFAEDLVRCNAVITTSGNQLIGEAFHLKKPVLAFPEPGNFEQHINATLLNASGGGRAVSHRNFSPQVLSQFLTEVDAYREVLNSRESSGNRRVLQLVDSLLNHRGPTAVGGKDARLTSDAQREISPGARPARHCTS